MSKSWLAWALAAGALSFATVVACGSDDAEQGGGTGGATGGTGGTAGSGVDAGGTGGTAGTGGSAGAGGAAGTGGATPDAGGSDGGPAVTYLGAKCKNDTECDGGTCLLPGGNDFYGIAGPAGGYCTKDCTAYANDESLPDPCVELSATSTCVPINSTSAAVTKAVCFEGCPLGPPLGGQITNQLDPEKCHGRHDMACVQPTDDNYNPVGIPYCQPLCQRDSDCSGAQRKCDPRLKMCVDEANLTEGLPFGSSCADYVESEGDAGMACEGICLGLRKSDEAGPSDPLNVAYFCSERCVFNTIDGCGFTETPPGGVCLIASPADGSGDEAYCLQMCDVDSDCTAYSDPRANAYCDPIGIQGNWGRGFCFFNYGMAEAGTDASIDGAADASSDATSDVGPCGDSSLNGNETDVDCGGPDCAKCVDGKLCLVGTDCVSGNCADPGDGGPKVCAP